MLVLEFWGIRVSVYFDYGGGRFLLFWYASDTRRWQSAVSLAQYHHMPPNAVESATFWWLGLVLIDWGCQCLFTWPDSCTLLCFQLSSGAITRGCMWTHENMQYIHVWVSRSLQYRQNITHTAQYTAQAPDKNCKHTHRRCCLAAPALVLVLAHVWYTYTDNSRLARYLNTTQVNELRLRVPGGLCKVRLLLFLLFR